MVARSFMPSQHLRPYHGNTASPVNRRNMEKHKIMPKARTEPRAANLQTHIHNHSRVQSTNAYFSKHYSIEIYCKFYFCTCSSSTIPVSWLSIVFQSLRTQVDSDLPPSPRPEAVEIARTYPDKDIWHPSDLLTFLQAYHDARGIDACFQLFSLLLRLGAQKLAWILKLWITRLFAFETRNVLSSGKTRF